MTTLAPPPAVTAYANAVRDHLAGLDAETLDELTGGLEADLAEALSERSPDGGAADLAAVTSLFGSPGLYAEELRSAAGVELPQDVSRDRATLRAWAVRRTAHALDTWQGWRDRNRWFDHLVGFLVALRPVWWVLRAWVLFHLVTGLRNPFFGSGLNILLLLTLVVVSVTWGQRRFGQQRWWRRLGLAASTLAVLAVIPTITGLQARTAWPDSGMSGYSAGYADGQLAVMQAGAIAGRPSNLFVYGPDGQPIEDAQIVDQDGNPVVLSNAWTGTSWSDWSDWEWSGEAVPAPVLDGAALNVYPWSYLGPEHLTMRNDGTVFGHTPYADDPQWPAAMLFPVPTWDTTEEPTDPSPSGPSTDEAEGAAGSDDDEAGGGEPGDDEPGEAEPGDDATTDAGTEGSDDDPGEAASDTAK